MSCIPFWLDDPIAAITNLRSIIPRANQCINEKLNSLSLFSIVFAVLLWAVKVPYAWAFGALGLLCAVLLKLLFFDKENGELTLEQYTIKQRRIRDPSRYIPSTDGDEEEFAEMPEDEIHFIKTSPYLMEGTDGSWESLKNSAINDELKSRIPNVIPLTRLYGDICVV